MELQINNAHLINIDDAHFLAIRLNQKEHLEMLDSISEVCKKVKDSNKLSKLKITSSSLRSLSANGYFWLLLDKLAEKIRQPKNEIYRHYIKNIGGNSVEVNLIKEAVPAYVKTWEGMGIGWVTEVIDTFANSVTLLCYYGSSTYDTKQMSRLIELVVFDCKENDIETLTPDEISKMVGNMKG